MKKVSGMVLFLIVPFAMVFSFSYLWGVVETYAASNFTSLPGAIFLFAGTVVFVAVLRGGQIAAKRYCLPNVFALQVAAVLVAVVLVLLYYTTDWLMHANPLVFLMMLGTISGFYGIELGSALKNSRKSKETATGKDVFFQSACS